MRGDGLILSEKVKVEKPGSQKTGGDGSKAVCAM